ncbi:7TM diverse intracellular signaling domain-containing protein [Maridesulfovibrio hydrothermalis]|uniref:Putative PAS/PAC sensor protein n=1 Tax=Maridesulfovibrio hydrothermalis AM13 = DSM 14728 TaxID=1121451 RepID=L0RFE8_9BACT|nr:7TM diverse intracellular signaling domain-containing protein [Maridesulfovibrio hydrothermalis]CCO25513.1 putative PAS/PAC sensor protein [Maridesulfovibrio hydrothermalis AM13 = DSM 14728]
MFSAYFKKLFISASILLLILLCGCERNVDAVGIHAVQGRLDLSNWDFEQKGPAHLDGEWEFYSNQVDATQSFDNFPEGVNKDFFPIPSLWKGRTAQGVTLAKQGQGVYRLNVKLPPDSGERSLYISGVLSVCRVLVNGKEIAFSGTIGKDRQSEIPNRHFLTPVFSPVNGYADIVLEVSNFHNQEGGINSSILLGSTEQIQDLINYRHISGAIIGGALLIMGIYHLVIFMMRRSNRENLYFGLFCLVWCTSTVFNPSSAFLVTRFFTMDWGWYVKICLLPAGLAIPLLLLFYNSLFPQKYGQKINRVYSVIGGLYLLYILIAPPGAYSSVVFAYFIISRTAYIYLFACFINDLRKRRKGAVYLAPGYLAIVCAELDEIFFDMNIFSSVDFAPFGTFIFIVSYSLFMSARFAETLSSCEKMSGELKVWKKNEHDHKMVHARLSGMLDSVDEAILAVNRDLVIDFCNNAFESLSGFSAETIHGQKFDEMIHANGHHGEDDFVQYLRNEASAGKAAKLDNIKFPVAGGDSVQSCISIRPMKVGSETIYVLVIRRKVRRLDRRQLAVKVMNDSIECWEKGTGRDKAGLAVDSGIWNVYLEKDGYARTQTLDRYLCAETLPLRPRWKNIYATAEFVLVNCTQQTDCYSELEKSIIRLKKCRD